MKKRILLAGPCAATILFERAILNDDDYEFVVADERGALDRARDCELDLVLLDGARDPAAGLAVCRAIRAHLATPIVIATAASDMQFLRRATEAGCNGVVRKPFLAAELRSEVRRLLRV